MFLMMQCNDAEMDSSKHRQVIRQRTCFRRAQRASKGCDSHHWIHRASCMPLDQRETFWGLRWPQSTNDGLRSVISCPQQRDIAAVCETMEKVQSLDFYLHFYSQQFQRGWHQWESNLEPAAYFKTKSNLVCCQMFVAHGAVSLWVKIYSTENHTPNSVPVLPCNCHFFHTPHWLSGDWTRTHNYSCKVIRNTNLLVVYSIVHTASHTMIFLA